MCPLKLARSPLISFQGSNFAIRNAIQLSRARVVTFRHNDTAHLETILAALVHEYSVKKIPLNRRYIILESIYLHTGDIAPLAEIIRLKHEYKFRIVLDESLAFGVLGRTGRGLCEHVGADIGNDVEIVCGSMGNALGSVGGFCVGDREMIDH